MSEIDTSESECDWWAEPDEVLVKKEDGSIWHVSARLEDVDGGDRRYYLWDDTHTRNEYWYGIDLQDCFKKTSVFVRHSRKPKHLLDGRMYDEDWQQRYLDLDTDSTETDHE